MISALKILIYFGYAIRLAFIGVDSNKNDIICPGNKLLSFGHHVHCPSNTTLYKTIFEKSY